MFVEPTYNGLVRGRPPFLHSLFGHDGWWGAQEWLVRAEMPAPEYADHVVDTPKVGEIVHAVSAAGPGVEADLRTARFSPKAPHHALIPVGADLTRGVDPQFLHYAEAAAGVEKWRWVGGLSFAGAPGGVLVGRRSGVLVAIVAPVSIDTDGWV